MRTLRLTLFAAAALLSALAFAGQGRAGTFSQIGTSRWVAVSHAYDGDTFKTDSGEKVRLLGINTPELARDDKPGQPLAGRATDELRALVQGKTVRLEFDKDRHDNYGRLLAHVYLRDGTWVNAHMIESGLAHAYTFAPNFLHTAALLDKERQARSAKRGIWNSDRFQLLQQDRVSEKHIGQFRLVSGHATAIAKNGWGFRLGRLSVTIPRSYRKWFKAPPKLKHGDFVTVHGKIRISNRGKLYLALHSPYNLEIIKR